MLQRLARDHRKFQVEPAHYDAVGRALIGAIREYSYGAWTERDRVGLVAHVQRRRPHDDRRRGGGDDTPAFWNAEVLSIERRSPRSR